MARKYLDLNGLDHLIAKLDQRYGGGGGTNTNIPEKAFYTNGTYFYEVNPSTPTWQASSQYIRRISDFSGTANVNNLETYLKQTLLGMASGFPNFEGLQFCNASIIPISDTWPSRFDSAIKTVLGISNSYKVDSIRIQAIGAKYSAAECSLKIEVYLWNTSQAKAYLGQCVIISRSSGTSISTLRID